ncbi:Modulator of retrovirus infection [Microtus ochrogaster]|nr:Modulator of retrovirus infection [Microtus ochrogaster]
MNEAEMVDVALGILIEGQKQETASLVTTDKLQLSPPYSASAHTSSPGSSSEEEGGSRSSSPALDLSPSQGSEATDSPCSSSPKEEKEEEDVLKYVREIFFS